MALPRARIIEYRATGRGGGGWSAHDRPSSSAGRRTSPCTERPAGKALLKTRILHIIYSFFDGGAEHLIASLVSNADSKRFVHGICVLGSGGKMVADLRREGVDITLLEKRKGPSPGIVRSISWHISTVLPDIIHLHGCPAGFWGTAASFFGRHGIPIVRTEHRPWLPGALPFMYRSTYRRQAARASRIIAVSEHARRSFLASFPALEDKFITIHNGIDPGDFDERGRAGRSREDCRRWFGLPRSALVIGTVGRLVPVKNHLLLLGAFARVKSSVPEAHLAILGGGELENAIISEAARSGIRESISIIPPTPAVALFLGALDIFALSSNYEGLPLSILEAYASGLPAVATSAGGIPEVVEDGANGYLCPPGDAAALAAGLIRLAESPSLRAEFGGNGRRRIAEHFTASRCAAETEKVYSRVLSGLSR